jgi:hypothetical protein
MNAPDDAELQQMVIAALVAAIDDDMPTLETSMNRVSEGGWNALYGACCAFAAALHTVCPVPGNVGDFMALAVVNVDTGQAANPDETDIPREVLTAARLIVAIGNEDFKAGSALFFAAVDEGYGHDACSAVLALSAHQIARTKGLR